MQETKNKTQVSFSLDREIVKEFDRIVPNGEKSSTLNELIKDFLTKSGSFKTDPRDILAQKALASQRAAEEYESVKAQFDRSELVKSKQSHLLEVERERSDLFNALNDQAKAQARVEVLVELGLDPSVTFVPESLRSDFISKWKDRHFVVLEKKLFDEKSKGVVL